MHGNWIDILVLIGYVVMMIAITCYARKKASSLSDFLHGGGSVGGWMSAFAYGTTYFSAVIFIGYAGSNGVTFGLASITIGIANAIVGSFLAWQVLAKRTRRLTRHLGSTTMSEMLASRYDSKHLKLIAGLLIFVFIVPYAAGVYQGLGYLFELVFGIPFWIVVIAMSALTALYLFFGGYYATALTDFVQGIIMLVGIVIMVGFVYNYEAVGSSMTWLKDAFGGEYMIFPELFKDGKAHGYTLLMLVILTSFGAWGMPQIVHKFHAINSEKAIPKAKTISTAFALVVGIGAYFVGVMARYSLVDAASMPADFIVPTLLVKALPAGLLGLIVILIMSASMSTLSSLTLSSASAMAVDLYKGYIRPNAPEKNVKLLLRLLCIAFIAFASVLAIAKPTSIINLMSFSWGTLAGCFLPPYLYGLYCKRVSKAGAYSSIITSLAVTTILYIVSLAAPGSASILSPPAIGVYAMIASLVVMPIVSRFSRPVASEHVDKIFEALKAK